MSELQELEAFKEKLRELKGRVEVLKSSAPCTDATYAMNGILDAISEVEGIIDPDIRRLEEQGEEISLHEYDWRYNAIRIGDVL